MLLFFTYFVKTLKIKAANNLMPYSERIMYRILSGSNSKYIKKEESIDGKIEKKRKKNWRLFQCRSLPADDIYPAIYLPCPYSRWRSHRSSCPPWGWPKRCVRYRPPPGVDPYLLCTFLYPLPLKQKKIYINKRLLT